MKIGVFAALGASIAFGCVSLELRAQTPLPSATPPAAPIARRPPLVPAQPLYDLDKAMLKWPGDARGYEDIDGDRLKIYVEEQVAISRRSKARGDRLWGRIIGSQADRESEEWLLDKYRKAGLQNIRSEPIALPPQWL